MNSTNSKPNANSGGLFNAIGKAFSNAKNAVVGSKNANALNSTRKNTSKNANVMPASTGVPNVPVTTGGMAPANFRYPINMQQPSEKVMEWATTAGAPMPPAAMMRNVAHGGKRRRTHRSKSRRGGSKRKSYRNKKRGGKRSTMNRNKNRRNKSCGGSRRNRNKSRRNRNRSH